MGDFNFNLWNCNCLSCKRSKGLWEGWVQSLPYQFRQSEFCFSLFTIVVHLLISIFFFNVSSYLTFLSEPISLSRSPELRSVCLGRADIKLTGAAEDEEERKWGEEEESEEEMNKQEGRAREEQNCTGLKKKKNMTQKCDENVWRAFWMPLLFLLFCSFCILWLLPLWGCPENDSSTLYVWLLLCHEFGERDRLPRTLSGGTLRSRRKNSSQAAGKTDMKALHVCVISCDTKSLLTCHRSILTHTHTHKHTIWWCAY